MKLQISMLSKYIGSIMHGGRGSATLPSPASMAATQSALKAIQNPALRKYREHGFAEVEGWCSEGLFSVMDILGSVDFNTQGGVCEIGVHHGKFFLLLNALTQLDDRSFAIDVFEAQALNIDASGHGSKEIFQKNLGLYDAHGGGNTTLIHADSTDPKAIRHLEETVGSGAIRFFSIDGGHTVRQTVSDLHLANRLTSNAGVVILDDILNHHWLGVIEGAVKFLQQEPTLVPFAIGHNKLFLCKTSHYERYFSVMDRSSLRTKTVMFMGQQLVAI